MAKMRALRPPNDQECPEPGRLPVLGWAWQDKHYGTDG